MPRSKWNCLSYTSWQVFKEKLLEYTGEALGDSLSSSGLSCFDLQFVSILWGCIWKEPPFCLILLFQDTISLFLSLPLSPSLLLSPSLFSSFALLCTDVGFFIYYKSL